MIIADLNHLETISENMEIIGGGRRWKVPSATAEAFATADALGFKTESYTDTYARAVAGSFSSSGSHSFASSKGY